MALAPNCGNCCCLHFSGSAVVGVAVDVVVDERTRLLDALLAPFSGGRAFGSNALIDDVVRVGQILHILDSNELGGILQPARCTCGRGTPLEPACKAAGGAGAIGIGGGITGIGIGGGTTGIGIGVGALGRGHPMWWIRQHQDFLSNPLRDCKGPPDRLAELAVVVVVPLAGLAAVLVAVLVEALAVEWQKLRLW